MQIELGMRVTLRQRGRKDYTLLYTERMVYISLVINAFKKKICVVNVYKMFLCIFFYLLLSKFFGFSLLALVLQMWSFFWSLEAPSDGDLLWFFLCRWSRSRTESQPLEIL